MKKKYLKPKVNVIILKSRFTLFSGSDPTRSIPKADEEADENYEVL